MRLRAQTPLLSQGEIHPRTRLKTVGSIRGLRRQPLRRPYQSANSSLYRDSLFIHSVRASRFGVVMSKFDYSAPAELYPARSRKTASKVKYRRFDTAADAIRFAVEELPEPQLLGATIEIDEERYGHKDIRALYESENYPLKKMN
jgi:hypothetical protein